MSGHVMIQSKTSTNQHISPSLQEEILVVKRDTLFPQGAWHGIKGTDIDSFLSLVRDNSEFHPRFLMEEDPVYKQIIPYLIFQYEDRYFLMQRRQIASEQRLKNKLSMGIGGHMIREDRTNETLFGWAEREFNEEVNFKGTLSLSCLGILNDDTSPVGQVHIGIVLLAKGDSDAISIKSELKSGTLMTMPEILTRYEELESWSQMAADHLRQR